MATHVDPLLWYFRPKSLTKYPEGIELGAIVKRGPRYGARYLREWALKEQLKHPATFDVEIGHFSPFQGFRLPGGGKVRIIEDGVSKKRLSPATFDKPSSNSYKASLEPGEGCTIL